MFNKIVRLPGFSRDLKKLLKRFRTLEEDLDTFIKTALRMHHKLHIEGSGIVEISGLGVDTPRIYKARKFACKSLKGKGANSGIRVIYAYYDTNDCIELIEIYYKGDKGNEDRERIKNTYVS
jgi:mRNA-degrading endonuclease RelE of RelBE toxin-antitoxin system